MPKMSIDKLTPIKMAGPVMGTRWQAELGLPAGVEPQAVQSELAAAVAQVDRQMSTWKPDSDLMRLNRAPVGEWIEIPPALMQVLERGLEIGRASGGAFDIGLGDLAQAWGFGAEDPDETAIRANLGQSRQATHDILELDTTGLRARKQAPLALDLSGIAKGFAVDRMMQVCEAFAIPSALVALDGELRSKGRQPDNTPWSVAIEKPDYDARLPLSMLDLQDAAVATSGDYRHWIEVSQTRFSHTMDRRMGGPTQPGIAAVTVVAEDCMTADAMATAILVLGVQDGSALAQREKVNCLILERVGHDLRQHGVGPLFEAGT